MCACVCVCVCACGGVGVGVCVFEGVASMHAHARRQRTTAAAALRRFIAALQLLYLLYFCILLLRKVPRFLYIAGTAGLFGLVFHAPQNFAVRLDPSPLLAPCARLAYTCSLRPHTLVAEGTIH